MQADALAFIHAMPICGRENQLLSFTQCSHQTLKVIEEVLEATGICGEDTTGIGNCARETVGFKRKTGRVSSIGRRVLMYENGLKNLAFVRYKSRVLDYLEANSSGKLSTTQKTIQIPKALNTIWSSILDDSNPMLTSMTLGSLATKFKTAFSKSTIFAGHGTPIFTKIADSIPEAEFVIVESEEKDEAQHLCDAASGSNPKALTTFVSNLAQSLIEEIKDQRIDYVNLSMGHTVQALKAQANQFCPELALSTEQLHAALQIWLQHFYIPLSSLDGVVLVQAATQSVRPLAPFDSEYAADCIDLPNRLRVGSFSPPADLEIAKDGTNDFNLLESAEANALPCTDLYIAGPDDAIDRASTPPERYQKYASFTATTFGCGPLWPTYPSWAAPIAVVYLIKLNEAMPAGTTTAELIAAATNYGMGRLKDPARHELYPPNLYARKTKL